VNRATRVGVVIPAHDEAGAIGTCLRAVERAARHARAAGCFVDVYVVCDHCTDDTASIVRARGHRAIEVVARNVGRARALGSETALNDGVSWLAFTDADSVVSDTWLVQQLALATDVVCGTVHVDDWSLHDPLVRLRYEAEYRDHDDHRHIHGANLGIAASAYRLVGGFADDPCDEDVNLVTALVKAGVRIAWSARPRVRTSARSDYRAPRGFGAFIDGLARTLPGAGSTLAARNTSGDVAG
jgi:glycosyltransferase involved in cell wall biosynthesis